MTKGIYKINFGLLKTYSMFYKKCFTILNGAQSIKFLERSLIHRTKYFDVTIVDILYNRDEFNRIEVSNIDIEFQQTILAHF